MEPVSLFFKEHTLRGTEVEIIFHKEFVYLLNESSDFPVIKFTLLNCLNAENIKFENIDFYNDGVNIEILNGTGQVTFRTTDKSGTETNIFCEKVITQDLDYRQSDLIDIIKSINKERDENNERIVFLNYRMESLKNTLTHDLVNLQRKHEEAIWLSSEKRNFIEGQIKMINQVLEFFKKN